MAVTDWSTYSVVIKNIICNRFSVLVYNSQSETFKLFQHLCFRLKQKWTPGVQSKYRENFLNWGQFKSTKGVMLWFLLSIFRYISDVSINDISIFDISFVIFLRFTFIFYLSFLRSFYINITILISKLYDIYSSVSWYWYYLLVSLIYNVARTIYNMYSRRSNSSVWPSSK